MSNKPAEQLKTEIKAFWDNVARIQTEIGVPKIFAAATADIIHIAGKKAKIISKNYQTGEVSFVFDNDVPPGYAVYNQMTFSQLDEAKGKETAQFDGYWMAHETPPEPRCTCGMASLAPGNWGKHSDWCSLYKKWED